jgi:transposase-like protein
MVYNSWLDYSSQELPMPWKERAIVEERMRFVLGLKDGESMSSLCREFGISRVTGYKIYERYKECGLEGLTDRARTPYSYANKLPVQLEAMILTLRREKPTRGARKLRERLLNTYSGGSTRGQPNRGNGQNNVSEVDYVNNMIEAQRVPGLNLQHCFD